MQPIWQTGISKYKENYSFVCDDILVREIRLDIVLNNTKVGSMMATPTDLEALGIGYLLSENIIINYADIKDVKFNENTLSVEINAKINEEALKNFSFESVIISGCGRSMTANLNLESLEAKIIKNDIKFRRADISKQMSEFYTQCELYEKTGCVHTAKLFTKNGEFYIGEDIAQHNTIDKAIGKAVMSCANLKDSFLMVSGRLSSEMVVKAVMNGIPLLVSRTAPTSLGVLIARKFNLSLCGFARGENLNVYSGAERIYA